MYARGIVIGKLKYELGDHAFVRCPETGLEAVIDFKVKGWIGGTYNAIGGFIKETASGKNLYELSGFWHGEMFIKDLTTGKKELLFDATNAKPTMVKARPLAEQGQRESQRLWDSTCRAIRKGDHRVATDEKSRIEDQQRREAAAREDEGVVWQPKLFKPAPAGDEEKLDWIINATVDDKAPVEKQVEQILAIAPILPASSSNQASQVPSEQGTPKASATEHSAAGAGGDLIDFGQNDGATGSAVPSQPTQPTSSSATTSASNDLAQGMGNMSLQQPLQPSRPAGAIQRMDSMGNEETFIDAET
jgi:oxysterol-binding protein-related protein 8